MGFVNQVNDFPPNEDGNQAFSGETPAEAVSSKRKRGLRSLWKNQTAKTRQQVAQRRNRLRPLFSTVALGLILGFLILAVFLVPIPYVVYGPGPTVNILGESGGEPVLTVEGGQSGDDDGELRLVTVSELGGPGNQNTTLADVISATFTPGYDVRDYASAYGDQEITGEQKQQAVQAQMESSQSTAPAAALAYLGETVPAEITVAGAMKDSPADGKFEAGDKLVSIRANGEEHPMNFTAAPFALMESLPAGTDIEVTVERAGKEVVVPLTTAADPEDPQGPGSKAGMALIVNAELPIDVQFHLEKIGGPSAGTMFAVAVIDQLTEGSLTGGKKIAGTGTMSYTGQVGPVGGVVQKMYGAARDGVEWFLVPEDNCDVVSGNIPKGLEVFSIATLADAVQAVEAIGNGDTGNLATCPAS